MFWSCGAALSSVLAFFVWGFSLCCVLFFLFSLVFLRCGGGGLPVCPLLAFLACRCVSCGSPCSRRRLFPSLCCVPCCSFAFRVPVLPIPVLACLLVGWRLGSFRLPVGGFAFLPLGCRSSVRLSFLLPFVAVSPVVSCSGGFGSPGGSLSSACFSSGYAGAGGSAAGFGVPVSNNQSKSAFMYTTERSKKPC